ncbi:MAG TPA: endonuclease/exonuclease/phosphatase family protein, partial [Puia sp.]|nr:endonuclease/exonuclease/phosphatase family protein [Puia sp.]
MPKIRSYARHLFIIVNGVVVLLFLLACANGFLPPGKWWLIALLGLAFPYLFLFVASFFAVTVSMPALRRWSLLSLAALLIGWSNIRHFIALHPGDRFVQQRRPGTAIRILTWNVRSFDDFVTRKRPPVRHRTGMLEFIGAQQADVLCLQEFYEALTRHGPESNITYIQEQLHYPYYYFSRDYTRPGLYEAGVVIFSRFPIVDSSCHAFLKPYGFHTTESLISADLVVGADTVRVYTTHLQSVLFGSKEFRDLQIIRNVDDSIVDASRSIVRKLRE